jgi:hypothetical protein
MTHKTPTFQTALDDLHADFAQTVKNASDLDLVKIKEFLITRISECKADLQTADHENLPALRNRSDLLMCWLGSVNEEFNTRRADLLTAIVDDATAVLSQLQDHLNTP